MTRHCRYGLGPVGVEDIADKGFVRRGVLLDAAALRGVEMLEPPKGGDASDPGNITDIFRAGTRRLSRARRR